MSDPAGEDAIVPTVELPPPIPWTSQVTEALELGFCTTAVKMTVPFAATELTGAETLMVGAGAGVIVRVAEPKIVVFDWSTAVIVTTAGLGTAAGAV